MDVYSTPVYDFHGEKDGPMVVITAGMDGDEFAGIESAKYLAGVFQKKGIRSGRLIIIPLVNRFGFDAKTSKNPKDGKYLRHIYPGKKNGTSSEQLVYWLSSKYISHAGVWIDLHGGATNETLTSFIASYQSENANVNTRTKRLLMSTNADIRLYQTNYRWGKIETLAKGGCSYVMCESGEMGLVRKEDIARHVSWVSAMLSYLGMCPSFKKNIQKRQVLNELHEYYAKSSNSVWIPCVTAGQRVKKGQTLGTVNAIRIVSARQNGIVLWNRLHGTASSSDTLVAIGR